MATMYYRIGEFARLGGVSIKTLRYYDEIGLLQPAAVDPRTQYRSYTPEQLHELATVLSLKELGARLEEIRRVMHCGASRTEQLKLLQKLRYGAHASMAAARRSLLWIEGALSELENGGREVAVVTKSRASLRVASVRAQAESYAAIGELERDLHHSVAADCAGEVQGVLWHRCAASGVIEGEPFVQVSSRARRCSAYEVHDLPAATFATAYCEPTDRDAERVYDAVSRWIHLHEYRLDGPKREIYLGQILEVQFPVRPA